MAEHLAVVPARALTGLLRRRRIAWTRRRREAPIGRVRRGDAVFFKVPGGLVVAVGTVATVREARKGGQYVLTLRFRGLKKLAVTFPVIKRDRRSWVVCAEPKDPSQQPLIARTSPTIADVLRVVRSGRRRPRSRRAIRALLARVADAPGSDPSLLLWLAFLAVAPDGDVVEALGEYLRRPASRVVPFAVFS